MSLKKSILKNSYAAAFQKIIKAGGQLILVPFFISNWGAEYYGEWITLTIVPSVLAFANFGFGSAAGNSFVLTYLRGDRAEAANINKSGIFLISMMVILGALLSISVLLFLDKLDLFEASIIPKKSAITALIFLIIARLLNFYSQLFESYFRAARKASAAINLFTLNDFFTLLTGVIILLNGYKVVAYACSQLIITIIFICIFYFRGKSFLGNSAFDIGEIKKSKLREISNKGFGYFLSPVWQSVYFQGTTFVVRIILGPESVAVFNTVRTLTRSVNQVFSFVNISIFPELQYEIGLGNWEKARKIFRMSILIVLTIAVLGILFLSVFGLWFYDIWTHNELNVTKSIWNIFILGILFNAIWWTSESVFKATNSPYKFSFIGLIFSIVSVCVTYFLTTYLGLIGAAIGSVSLDILMAIFIFPICLKILNMSRTSLFKNSLKDFIILFNQLKTKYHR